MFRHMFKYNDRRINLLLHPEVEHNDKQNEM
jgi:hypothetical protein